MGRAHPRIFINKKICPEKLAYTNNVQCSNLGSPLENISKYANWALYYEKKPLRYAELYRHYINIKNSNANMCYTYNNW